MFEWLSFLFQDILFYLGYLSSHTAFPKPLTAKEEREAIEKMQGGDQDARRKLVEHNLRLVAHIARKYTVQGFDADDLISIGTIGLIKAINTFRPETGATLSTYVSRCIENEILMCLRASQKRKNDVSLSEPIGTDAEGNEITLIDVLGTEPDSVEEETALRINLETVRRLIREVLPPRERTVIEMRYGLGDGKARPQFEIAEILGISRSYVSRLEKKAVKMLEDGIKGDTQNKL